MSKQESTKEQLTIIDGQLVGCILYIISLVASILIILNQRKRALGEKEFLTAEESQTIALLNKILILALILWFLYLNNRAKNFAANTNQDTSALNLQVIASFISLIPALIGLYVVITNFSNSSLQTAEIENSNL